MFFFVFQNNLDHVYDSLHKIQSQDKVFSHSMQGTVVELNMLAPNTSLWARNVQTPKMNIMHHIQPYAPWSCLHIGAFNIDNNTSMAHAIGHLWLFQKPI